MPAWAQVLSALVVALTAATGAVVAWRRSAVDRRQSDAGASASYAATTRAVLEEMEGMRARLDAAERRSEQHEEAERRCASELTQTKGRVAALERMLPMLLASEVLESFAEPLREALDDAGTPIVVTTSAGGGSFVFANRAFCEAVRRPQDELLGQGWRRYVDPLFLARTDVAEGLAHAVPVHRFVNRYLRPDGSPVLLRWSAAPYNTKGATIAFARVLDSEGAA